MSISTLAQGTAFTYQGKLNFGGVPASGLFDFRLRLCLDPLGSTRLGVQMVTNAVPTSNGLFSLLADFGPGIFTGSNLWLEVDVKTNGAADYTVLEPLQPLNASPYAIFAGGASNLSGTLPAGQLSGTISNAALPANPVFSGTVTAAGFAGNGANLVGVPSPSGMITNHSPAAMLSGIFGDTNVVDIAWFGGSPTNMPGANAAAFDAAIQWLTNTWGGTLRFGSGIYQDSGHHRLPESGGWTRAANNGQPGIRILGSGNTVLLSTETNASNGPFLRGGIDWEEIVIRGPGMQYGTTGLVQSLPGNNHYTHVKFAEWGTGMLADDATHVVGNDVYFFQCDTGLKCSFKCDGWEWVGRVDFCNVGIELGAFGGGLGDINHPNPNTPGGPSCSDRWHLVANGNTNAVIIVGGSSFNQDIQLYTENSGNGGVLTNGYIWIGHDPAYYPGGGTTNYYEGSTASGVRIHDTKALEEVGPMIKVFAGVVMETENVWYESGTRYAVIEDFRPDMECSYDVKNTIKVLGPYTFKQGSVTLAAHDFRWGNYQGFRYYDREYYTLDYPFGAWRYQYSAKGPLRMGWADGNDLTMSTPYAWVSMDRPGTATAPYQLTLGGVSIAQSPTGNSLAVSNTLLTTYVNGHLAASGSLGAAGYDNNGMPIFAPNGWSPVREIVRCSEWDVNTSDGINSYVTDSYGAASYGHCWAIGSSGVSHLDASWAVPMWATNATVTVNMFQPAGGGDACFTNNYQAYYFPPQAAGVQGQACQNASAAVMIHDGATTNFTWTFAWPNTNCPKTLWFRVPAGTNGNNRYVGFGGYADVTYQ
ncbi:MAG TPA: hypothetical protein VG167_11400 [Verrucomicrobiae bacterium]|nr:hypothetical protein [Verrucomicrobiae bacterium]